LAIGRTQRRILAGEVVDLRDPDVIWIVSDMVWHSRINSRRLADLLQASVKLASAADVAHLFAVVRTRGGLRGTVFFPRALAGERPHESDFPPRSGPHVKNAAEIVDALRRDAADDPTLIFLTRWSNVSFRDLVRLGIDVAIFEHLSDGGVNSLFDECIDVEYLAHYFGASRCCERLPSDVWPPCPRLQVRMALGERFSEADFRRAGCDVRQRARVLVEGGFGTSETFATCGGSCWSADAMLFQFESGGFADRLPFPIEGCRHLSARMWARALRRAIPSAVPWMLAEGLILYPKYAVEAALVVARSRRVIDGWVVMAAANTAGEDVDWRLLCLCRWWMSTGLPEAEGLSTEALEKLALHSSGWLRFSLLNALVLRGEFAAFEAAIVDETLRSPLQFALADLVAHCFRKHDSRIIALASQAVRIWCRASRIGLDFLVERAIDALMHPHFPEIVPDSSDMGKDLYAAAVKAKLLRDDERLGWLPRPPEGVKWARSFLALCRSEG
jgi:hypothetical protein